MAQISLKKRLKQALAEDDVFSDVTTRVIPGFRKKKAKVILLAKQKGIFCGAFLLKPIFSSLDPSMKFQLNVRDGARVKPGQTLATIKGKIFALLAGERLFLNLAGRLSGIATLTQAYVKETKGSKTKIFDTRKTTPLWRDLERKAVRLGGGQNHRFSLGDAVLIKDNHLSLIRSGKLKLSEVYAPQKLGKNRRKIKFIEIEAQSPDDVLQGIELPADIIMLDNMSVQQMKKSLSLIKAERKRRRTKKPLSEISGGVTLKKIRTFAQLGVDRISIGAITHSAPSLDLSMEVL